MGRGPGLARIREDAAIAIGRALAKALPESTRFVLLVADESGDDAICGAPRGEAVRMLRAGLAKLAGERRVIG